MNAVSSRSHSVFMLYITGRNEAGGTVLQGSLNLVDLAGRWAVERAGECGGAELRCSAVGRWQQCDKVVGGWMHGQVCGQTRSLNCEGLHAFFRMCSHEM